MLADIPAFANLLTDRAGNHADAGLLDFTPTDKP